MATALKLRYYGDPVLRKVAKPVEQIGPAERFFIQELLRAMYEFDGAGLAATQVGVEQQIFVGDDGKGPFVIINPEIIKKSSKKTVLEEGCLSFPDVHFHVDRPEEVVVRYRDENGQRVERTLSGMKAKIFQHESDHLFGRMIIDYASDAEKEKFKAQLKKIEAMGREAAAE